MILTTVLAAGLTLPVCSWDKPGANPFMGDVVAAVDNYKDIPEVTRKALKEKMQKRQYDDIAVIKRDSIEGKEMYSSVIFDMHFGKGNVCKTITRAQWQPTQQERGLVYCVGQECVIVPTVCRNVSRIRKPAIIKTAAKPAEDELLFDPPAAGQTPQDQPLSFDPPAAGPSVSPLSAPQTFAQAAPIPVPFSLTLPPSTSTPIFSTPPSIGIPPLPPGQVPAIPEPSSYILLIAGLSFILIRKKYVNQNHVV